MLALISPAKTLDFESEIQAKIHSGAPVFASEAEELVKSLKKLSVQDIEALMKVSKNIAKLNQERFQNFAEKDIAKAAIYAFKGDVYQHINLDDYTGKDLDFMGEHLRILSGLYGVIAPFDNIMPYRLEMGTKFSASGQGNLYKFWGEKIVDHINKLCAKHNFSYVINLASEEYFKAVQTEKLKPFLINISFLEKQAGKLKNIGIMSKRARGMMVDFMVKNHITKPEKLKDFETSGYKFDISHSEDSHFVFVKSK